ncbi:MAG TPA: hypothetical protein VEI27_01250 [Dehalococcoidales bacterium]|nr:hypothetical protein [Dehalococcoidales bacterium]
MQSALINKMEKAFRYAQEPERIKFDNFTATFHGINGDHTVNFKNNKWVCTCPFYTTWGRCVHTMAVEKMLDRMLPAEAKTNFKFEEKQ